MASHISNPTVEGDALTPDALAEVKLDVAVGVGRMPLDASGEPVAPPLEAPPVDCEGVCPDGSGAFEGLSEGAGEAACDGSAVGLANTTLATAKSRP